MNLYCYYSIQKFLNLTVFFITSNLKNKTEKTKKERKKGKKTTESILKTTNRTAPNNPLVIDQLFSSLTKDSVQNLTEFKEPYCILKLIRYKNIHMEKNIQQFYFYSIILKAGNLYHIYFRSSV